MTVLPFGMGFVRIYVPGCLGSRYVSLPKTVWPLIYLEARRSWFAPDHDKSYMGHGVVVETTMYMLK